MIGLRLLLLWSSEGEVLFGYFGNGIVMVTIYRRLYCVWRFLSFLGKEGWHTGTLFSSFRELFELIRFFIMAISN